MSAYLQRDVRLWRAYSSTSSQSAVGSRTLRIHHLTEAACLIGLGLHRMQILASCELPKFRSESCPAREGASPKGARPCPQRARGERCVTLAFPYDTNCIRIRVQGVLRTLGRGYALCGRTSH